jgi:hypothetical protein
MRTNWNQTTLADVYFQHSDYSKTAIDPAHTNCIKRSSKSLTNINRHESFYGETRWNEQQLFRVAFGSPFKENL